MGRRKVTNAETGKIAHNSVVSEIGSRIRYYRKRKGLEQKQLAAYLGITGNAITNWEMGRSRPDIGLIPDICDILDVSFSQLMGMDAPNTELSVEEKDLIREYRSLSEANQRIMLSVMDTLLADQRRKPERRIIDLPLYGKSLAAGIGDPSELQFDTEPFYLYDSDDLALADAVFKINGDSMEPKYHSGSYVLVQKLKGGSGLHFGETGAFIVGNELYIKEYQEDGLHSLNPAYPVMRFNDDTRVYLIGRVLRPITADEVPPKKEA